jgi:hypothetical protein
LALAVPLARFPPRAGGGSASYAKWLRMYFISAIIFSGIGVIFLSGTKTVARRQSYGTGICTAIWGGWGVTIGVLDLAHGFGRPLLTDHVQEIVLTVFTIVCLLSMVLIRKTKKS